METLAPGKRRWAGWRSSRSPLSAPVRRERELVRAACSGTRRRSSLAHKLTEVRRILAGRWPPERTDNGAGAASARRRLDAGRRDPNAALLVESAIDAISAISMPATHGAVVSTAGLAAAPPPWNAFPDAPLPADARSSSLQPPANPSRRRTVTGSGACHRNSAQTLDPLRPGDRPGRRKTNHPAGPRNSRQNLCQNLLRSRSIAVARGFGSPTLA